MNTESADTATRKTVVKALRILHAFSNESPELSINDLSELLGLHKSVVSRLVSTLHEWDMIEQDSATRHLRLGPGTFRLGMRYANQQPLQRLAPDILGRVVEKTRHSSYLLVLEHLCLLVTAAVESSQALRMIMRVGDHRMLHTTGAGKVFLAYSPRSLFDAVVREAGLPRLTPETITSAKELSSCVVRARAEGLGWNEGESTVGAGAVAAPVFGPDGRIVAALTTTYPLATVSERDKAAIGKEVKRAAQELSLVLGAPR